MDLPTEQILYLFRIPVLIITSVLLIILFAMATPQVDTAGIDADVFAARIATGGGFWVSPGIITEDSWDEREARAAMQMPGDELQLITARAEIFPLEGGDRINEPIIYNPEAHETYQSQSRLRGIHTSTFDIPVKYEAKGEEPQSRLLRLTVYVKQ